MEPKAEELLNTPYIVSNIDLGDPETFRQGAPVEFLDELRETTPIAWHYSRYENKGFWVVTDAGLYDEIIKNPDIFSSERRTVKLEDPEGDDMERQRHFLLNMDPPKHRAYRKMISKMFTTDKVKALRGFFEETAVDIFDSIEYGAECDVIEVLSNAMPLAVISHIIGLGELSVEKKKLLANAVHVILYPEEETYLKEGKPNTQSVKLFSQGLALYDRHANGEVNSLISVLVNGEADGNVLSHEEFIFQFLFMYVAGYETTRSAIASAVKLFCEHPEQYQKLRENPELVKSAVEEVLRYESTHWHHCRTATRDVELNGVQVNEGEKIALFYHGINRDPKMNDSPEVFDITRSDPQHRSFGHGIHLCLGAFLAREELFALFSEMIKRVSHMEGCEDLVYARSSFLNGFVKMNAVFHK